MTSFPLLSRPPQKVHGFISVHSRRAQSGNLGIARWRRATQRGREYQLTSLCSRIAKSGSSRRSRRVPIVQRRRFPAVFLMVFWQVLIGKEDLTCYDCYKQHASASTENGTGIPRASSKSQPRQLVVPDVTLPDSDASLESLEDSGDESGESPRKIASRKLNAKRVVTSCSAFTSSHVFAGEIKENISLDSYTKHPHVNMLLDLGCRGKVGRKEQRKIAVRSTKM